MLSDIIIALLIGYFAGSIPFGLIITRLAGEGDVRAIGSGNIGATNVLRTGRKLLAVLTLVADILKGLIPPLIVNHFFGGIELGLLAGFAALIGHMFPLWLKFKGGKGVATYIGAALGIYWPAGLAFIGIWLLMAIVFRYSSLSALIAAFCAPLYTFFTADNLIATTLCLMSILVIMRHRSNIERLIAGQEDKIGQKSAS